MHETHASARSTNEKIRSHRVGGRDVAATYRPRTSCPDECSFRWQRTVDGAFRLKDGKRIPSSECYAGTRIDGMARRYGTADDRWVRTIIDGTRHGGLVRHFVVGDLLTADDTVDTEYVAGCERLHSERPDLTQYGYTHTHGREDVHPDILGSFVTLNASCETADEIIRARSEGWDTVVTVGTVEDARTVAELSGFPVTVCPAQRRDDIGCADCMLCAKRGRAVTVAFVAHGVSARRMSERLSALLSGE